MVSSALKSSGCLATTNCKAGPGASGGSRFLPVRFFAVLDSSLGDMMIARRDELREELEEQNGVLYNNRTRACCFMICVCRDEEVEDCDI